jgi:DNA processing protein
VGSRHCTELGRALARDLAAGLSRQGITVVSGLALGIDAAAHEGAIDGGGGTVAVLASPVDDPQPKSNTALATEIAAGSGWLVSERPPLSVVRGPDFPWRNRIVAGLAGALVVVEAGLRSGTLSTVEHALAVGVDVGAVPGPATSPVSQGVHAMLKAGARVVTEVGDVLEMLGRPVADPSGAGPAGRDPDATALLAGFPGASGTDGEWLHCSRIEAGRARAALSRLLSRGELRRLPGGRVARVL